MDHKTICDFHKLPTLGVDSRADENEKFMCIKCIQSKFQIQPIEEYYTSEIKIPNKVEGQRKSTIKLFQELIEALELYKKQVLQAIDKFSANISQFIKSITEKQQIFSSIFQQKVISGNYNEELEIFQKIHNEGKTSLDNDLFELSTITKTNVFFNILKNFNPKIDIEEPEFNMGLEQVEKSISDDFSAQQSNFADIKFDYQPIKQSSYKQDQFCYAIAFNKDSSVLIASFEKQIRIFDFELDELKETQQLNEHTSNVYLLQSMKKSNQFISGSKDGSFIVWTQNENKQWQTLQVWKAHKERIYTIANNYNEDILISGSADKTIKFWSKENNTWNSKQSIECLNAVYSVSLSNKGDQLIASIHDNQIFVINLSEKQWIVSQRISVEKYGYRLCFINQNQFVFQPQDRQFLIIYNYDQKEQQFKQGVEVKYQSKKSDANALFPIQYIQQIGLILVKNDEHVYLIKREQNEQFKVEQSIHFGTYNLYGCISDDGRYIATWDSKSIELQIRKLSQ